MEAQVADVVEEPGLLLKKHMSGNLMLHNLGWGMGMRYGQQKTVKRDLIYEFDFVKMRHPKEVKIANPNFTRPPSYVYGKQNDLFVFRLGAGFENQLFRKGEKSGVELRYHLSAGASNAVMKPVYLLILPGAFAVQPIPTKYNPEEHFNEDIFGLADFSYGLDELGFRPGGYTKAGFIFEWGDFEEDIRTVEVGATLDVYAGRLPLMAFIQNKSTFVSFYIAMSFGKRW